MNILAKYLVTLFGIGFIPFAPGTLGSLCAIFVWYLSITFLNIYFFYLILIIVFFSSFILVDIYIKFEKKEDPSEVIIDEFIGQSIPIVLYELFHSNRFNSSTEALQIYFWFFLLFRLFDGLKPFPIDYVDKKYKNSFGILFDDVLAGFYVVLCLILFMVGKTFFF